MADIWETLAEMRRRGERGALAIVVHAEGSTPREPGSKMIVREDGSVVGSVGGGEFERKTVELALEVIRSGKPVRQQFALQKDLGMRCGGEIEVYIEPIQPLDKLVIFGAGHVGAAIAKLGAWLGFQVTVVDDRPGFACKERIPEAHNFLEGEYPQLARELPPDPHCYAVIVTHGHSHDDEVLQALVQKDLAYLGMIGSRRKVQIAFENLRKLGVPEERIARIRAPMGLDIGAETPEEIAISVLAEIVALRHGVDVSAAGMRERVLGQVTGAENR
ncbi:MAG: XdhC/CoxI family protein [candidate division KSB1 bacterium]|nr:XdhC/CoxI family protein [candidate division KSB1 bacterium]